MENVLAYLTSYKSKVATKKALEKEIDEMKAVISDYVLSKVSRDDKGKATVTVKPFTVSVTACKRCGLDEKTIRELFPEIAKEHEKVTVYDRVTVD